MSAFLRSHQQNKEIIRYIKNIFGFYPRKIHLYKLACTPHSLTAKNNTNLPNSNERLEFLGDAVLDAITADFVFKKFPLDPEGKLTEYRAKIVNREQLNKLAQKIKLVDIVNKDVPNPCKSAGGNAIEAIIGAIYLDKGFKKTKKIILNKLFLTYLDVDAIFLEENNFKSKILTYIQREHKQFEFRHSQTNNSKSRKLYEVKLFIDAKMCGQGYGYTIKSAEQEAAKSAWEKIENLED